MRTRLSILFCIPGLTAVDVVAQTMPTEIAALIRNNCLHCHDARTETRLNFDALDFDFTDSQTFRHWEDVYLRLSKGEMPPETEPEPDQQQRDIALNSLKQNLRSASVAVQRKLGRVPARRLTRTEYEYAVRDLLSIDGGFADMLPEESDEGSFDTVGSSQRLSGLHMESYLAAADEAISQAIRLGSNPYRKHSFDLLNSEHLNSFHEKKIQLGGNMSRKLDDGVVLFRDVDYLLRSDLLRFKVRHEGFYRISLTAEAFQSHDPVAVKVVVKDRSGQSDLVGTFDLIPGQTHSCNVEAYLTRTKVFYAALVEERSHGEIIMDIYSVGGAKKYQGKGVLVKSLHVEGPLFETWPPKSTRDLLGSAVALRKLSDDAFDLGLSDPTIAHVKDVVTRIAPRAFRRPLKEGELEALVTLVEPAIDQERDFINVLRIPLRTILSSPQFLMLTGKPGQLDDYALASRLSFFLWKTVPDDALLMLARQDRLSRPDVLAEQVDRMLNDDRSARFIRDYIGQWLRIDELNNTAPDEKLYPEYDDVLHWSIAKETESFFRELIEQDLSISNLIDSEFTFVNRRLATHYGIDGVTGQQMRRINLPPDSPRGGLLTQASILKITANGTVTSPVTRGNFVLSNLLGMPPPPPPENVGSIEPDTTGTTTIRETLKRHRDVKSCAKCHQKIDPPGFALECFDPIGGFRKNYRANFYDPFSQASYQEGPRVDFTGVMPNGTSFRSVQEFKQLLMKDMDQLAKHFIAQLVVYSTGGEIQFADRDKLDEIFKATRDESFPIRTIIHAVVQSDLFRNR